jgi:hypothetical protein
MPRRGYGQGVKVSVTRQGGFLDVDQKVEVDEDGVSVTERGVERQVTPVDQDRVRRVSKLAKAVAELRETAVPAPKAGDVAAYDEMLTEIEIDDGEGVRRLSVPSGADAHPAVWELISAVDQCASE